MKTLPQLHIRSIEARPVVVPITRPLYTSSGAVTQAPLLLIDLQAEEGVIGRSYLFGYQPFTLKPLQELVAAFGGMIAGDRVAPFDLDRKLRSNSKLMGSYHLAGMALAGLDMACWDALAIGLGLPLAELLGGSTGSLPAYNSNGLGIMPVGEVANEAAQLIAEGFHAIKIRLGRASAAEDLAAVRAVRSHIPSDAFLMADFNQALSVNEALHRGRMLDGEGLLWIEEPVRADDLSGCARVTAELRTPIQIGENFIGVFQMLESLHLRASDFVMPDVQRIGGVSGWMRAAALAQAAGCEMSSHLFPEVSGHLLAVTPTSHWLEYVDWASPILEQPLEVRDGKALIPNHPGSGIVWNERAVERFRVA